MANISTIFNKIKVLRERYYKASIGKDSLIKLISEAEISDQVYNSNAIENSTLSLEETEKILLQIDLDRYISEREIFEAKNLARVVAYIDKRAKEQELSPEVILSLHKMLLSNIRDEIAGRFRQGEEYVRVGSHIAPAPKEIDESIKKMIAEYNATNHENIIKRIARLHLAFEYLHPFNDGNGRIGRVINNYLLIREGFVPINIKFIDRKKYYNAFKEYDEKGATTIMEEIVGKALTNHRHDHAGRASALLSLLGGATEEAGGAAFSPLLRSKVITSLMSSLSELRQQYQDKQGGQTTDATSVARQNRVIQNVCRELFPKIPDQWFRQTWEIRLEAPVDLTAYYGQIYQETTGPSRFIYFGTLPASSGYIAIGATVLATDGTLSNRWLQVYRASDQKYIYRKIRQVVTYVSGIFTFRGVVMDEPWENTTDADLSCKILTLEYPLPGDVTRIRGLRWSTDGAYGGRSLMFGNGPTTMDVLRLGSTLSTGIPSVAGLASTHRIQAPHWTPVMAVGNGQSATAKWGFTAAGVERDSAASGAQYGAAGTFSYRSCIVWGRRPWLHPTKGWGFLGPWVMSPPTKASNQVTTTWGAGMVTGTLANIEYLHGFVNGSDSPCKDAAGLEHWVFRARHATEDPASASNHAAEKYLEADGAYYLWNIFPGSVSSFTDRGDADPADIAFPLKDYSPQSSLSFDVIASEATTLNASVIVRPRVATADEDTIEIPDGFDEIIMNRMVYYFQARRDADRGFMKDLDDTYMKLILELRRQSPFTPDVGAGAEFGNGLSTIDEWPTLWGPLRVIP